MNKKKNLAGLVGLMVVVLVAVVVGVSSYVKASSNSAKYNAEGDMIINEAPSEGNLGSGSLTPGAINSGTDFTQLGLISNENSVTWTKGFTQINMPAKGAVTTTAYFKNETGSAIYIDNHFTHAKFTETVSSTVAIACGLSTSGTGLAAYTTTPPVDIIAATNVVTSTVATTAGSLVQPAATIVGMTLVNNNAVILCGWYQPYDNGCTGAKCEAVTSTARGYNATINIPFYSVQQN